MTRRSSLSSCLAKETTPGRALEGPHVEPLTQPFPLLLAQGAMIERLSSDSRRAAPGVAFFAYPGEGADGRAHIADALRRGAAAVIWEEAGFEWRKEVEAAGPPGG